MMQERIQQLFGLCAKLQQDNPQVISLMNDILGYVDGNILECVDVIESKVVVLSKAISDQCNSTSGIITNTENTQEVFKRLSASALLGEGDQCHISKSDLSTILLAYTLELNKNNAAKE